MTEESDCPQHKAPGSPGKMHTVSMDRLKLLSKDVEQRRTVLGQSWDELQMVLSQYHASLVVRQEQFDMQCEDSNSYIAKLENELEKRNTEHDHLRSKLSEFERKVHGLEEENCSLRSEQERLAGELKVKENLVVKIQGQMSKEGLEYCAEISALKESLSKLTAEADGRRKRPRVEEVPVSKSDATPRDPAPSAESPPTFSMATMPHLALPTTSSDVLEKQNDVPVTSQYEPMTSQPEVGHQVIQVPPLSQRSRTKNRRKRREEIREQELQLTFTVKQEVVDTDHETKSTSSSLLDDDAYIYHKAMATGDGSHGNDGDASSHHGNNEDALSIHGNQSDDGNRSDSSLNNLDHFVHMSRPIGAPSIENSVDNDLAPIQIEKFRLPTGVIAMAPALNAAPPKMHHCPYCYRFFDKSLSLREHLKIHLGTHMYECELCSRKFTQKGNLERHQRAVHKDEMPLNPKKHYRKRRKNDPE